MTSTYNSREMPHPVLKPQGQDYQPSSGFTAKVDIRRMPETSLIAVGIQYELKSDGLEKLIQEEKASFQTLIQCVATRTRQAHSTQSKMHRIDLNAREYYQSVDLFPMIIAAQEIQMDCTDWNPGIKSMLPNGTNVPHGAILAIANRHALDLDTDHEYASLIDLVPNPNIERSRFNISLDGERIAIQVNPQDKPNIDRVRKSEDQSQNLYPSVYLSAIEKAVRSHMNDDHQTKRWAMKIREKLAEQGIDPDPEVLQDNSLEYAQIVMGSPLGMIIEPPSTSDEE